MSSPFYLLRTRRFAPLFVTQFLGAFNDNLFKNALAAIVTFSAASWSSLSAALLAPLIGVLFILPFFLFSAIAGELADSFDKAKMARVVKVWEIFLMLTATIGFVIHSFWMLLAVVFGLGVHSAFFGPIKYAIIPQHMGENELVSANALVESATFASILLGTILGGLLSTVQNGAVLVGIASLFFATLGYFSSRYIPTAPPFEKKENISLNIFVQTKKTIALAKENRVVFLSIVAISWFWLVGAVLLSQLPFFVKETLHGDETTLTMLLAFFTLGIGGGSMLCEKLSNHTIKLSLLMVGAVGMGIAGVEFSLIALGDFSMPLRDSWSFWHLALSLLLIGVFGGLFSVPLYSLLQLKSPASVRSSIIAANNIFNALFMVAGSLVTMAAFSLGFVIGEVFLALFICSLVVGVLLAKKLAIA